MLSKLLGAVGVVLLIAGVAFAVRPVHVDEYNCGSVIQPGSGVTPMQCDARLGSRGDAVVGLGIAGMAGLVAGLAVAAVRERRSHVTS